MNCQSCIKLNPIPACITDGETTFTLTGLTFPDNTDQDIRVKIRDTATGRATYIEATVTGDQGEVDLTSIYPMMDHIYTLEFFDLTGAPIVVVVSAQESCCIEFRAAVGLSATTWDASDAVCTAVTA